MTRTVLIPRGIPGSGKTTWAKDIIITHELGTVARINNDDIVAMTFDAGWRRQEGIGDLLHNVRSALLTEYLLSPNIEVVIIDNTNLSVRTVGALQKIAHKHGAAVEVVDDFLHVNVEVCINRDAVREHPVGEEVIRKMHKDAQKLKPWKYSEPPAAVELYNNTISYPKSCFIFDIDGTIALKGDRSPYDYSKVSKDTVNFPVAAVLQALSEYYSADIIFMSGRQASCLVDTQEWLYRHGFLVAGASGSQPHLYMRETDDSRPDYIVKNELFQKHIAGKYHVRGVFDDRDQVVDLWRNKLGLPTFQVANGAF